MASAKLPFGSIEYLHVPITRDDDSVAVDLTGVQIEVAILADGVEPSAPGVTWHLTQTLVSEGEVLARYLLDGTTARGRWNVWVRVGAGPELALRKAGLLTVT